MDKIFKRVETTIITGHADTSCQWCHLRAGGEDDGHWSVFAFYPLLLKKHVYFHSFIEM